MQELSFTQDYAGNDTAITDTLDSTRNESFGVDSLNRLHTASGKYGSRTYTYDNNSNRLTWYNGTITRTSSFNSGTNTVASITDGTNTRHLTWSASGNMLTDDRVMNGAVAVSTLTYRGRDRLEVDRYRDTDRYVQGQCARSACAEGDDRRDHGLFI